MLRYNDPNKDFEQLSNIVIFEGKSYLVDINFTLDHGLETMIFKSKPQPETDDRNKIKYSYINWADIYAETYTTKEAAISSHRKIVENISDYI